MAGETEEKEVPKPTAKESDSKMAAVMKEYWKNPQGIGTLH